MIVYSVGIGISMAATAMVARRIGEKEFKKGRDSCFSICFFSGGSFGNYCKHFNAIFRRGHSKIDGRFLLNIRSGMAATTPKSCFGSNIVIVLLFLINGLFRGAGNAQLSNENLDSGKWTEHHTGPHFHFWNWDRF